MVKLLEMLNLKILNLDIQQDKKQIVLEDFNLKIKAGSTVALVGQSGSGKSTVFQLLERFYDPEGGEVYIDDVNIRDIDPIWLHKKVGIVTQEPVLFQTTIKENILYGFDRKDTKDVDIDAAVITAAKNANAHNFIMRFPKKYETLVGERGVSMSGGQKQRIAIARAVLQNPKILLLDEATSALDTESEKIVQDALDKLMVGRTTFVIAHRLTTVKGASSIVCMKKGKVIEVGTHDELLEQDGFYASSIVCMKKRKSY